MVLEAVLAVLREHPEVKKLRVEGHTDNQGNAGDNKKLSQERATAVVAWLAGKGIDKTRLAAVGFGQERPVAPNTSRTAASSCTSRRIRNEAHVDCLCRLRARLGRRPR